MSKIYLNINGTEICGYEGQTILDIARIGGIEIPTLCHDERVEHYASCGICTVEVEGNPKLLRACSTPAVNGMIVRTNSVRVNDNRKTALELMLSEHEGDCRAPCMLACPAHTDCQGYVGLVANGEYKEANKLIRESIPLPASIGRICPRPCEEACRRELVEEPISIASIKQFVGDEFLFSDANQPEITANTGKSVAIIGGGPGGLSAAAFLRNMGHKITIYDSMPQMGGMLRYGIPEYRLPKKVLDAEIASIEKMGIIMNNNIRVGVDITLEYLRKSFDAVIIAIGAWKSSPLRCPGEELDGVIGGIDFLRDIAINNHVLTGRNIAIVGGGNTAMDACRTAIRLGAENVYNIYRRTRNEMPAEEIEIVEAEEEGVIFKNLTNPIEVVGNNGKVSAVRLQIMELGEPDASGRRAPVAVEGKEETLDVDTIIVAIGQKTALAGFEGLELTKWGTIVANEQTFETNLKGVFAIGDATNDGAAIACTAIGEAKKAAKEINSYLYFSQNKAQETYFSIGEKPFDYRYLVKSEKSSEDFANTEKENRMKMLHRSPEARRNDFLSVNQTLDEEAIKKEAHRCLECGCLDFFECKLLEYANEYNANPEKFGKVIKKTVRTNEKDHPSISFNTDKCILCGLCVRICEESVGAAALGLVDRGIKTTVKPALHMPLTETDCISCGMCASVCPTGAITDRQFISKPTPLQETSTETTCTFCSVGCKKLVLSKGNLITRCLPADGESLLCEKGRFGHGEILHKPPITTPLIEGREADLEEALVYTHKKLQSLQAIYGKDSIAVSISNRYSRDEIRLLVNYANETLGTPHVFSFGLTQNGLTEVYGNDYYAVTFNEMENTDLIIAVSPNTIIKNHGVAAMRIRKAVKRGAKLLLISNEDSLLDDIATLRIDMMADNYKHLLDMCRNESGKDGIPGNVLAAYKMIQDVKKVVFVFEKKALNVDEIKALGSIAVSSNKCEAPRGGIIQLQSGAGSEDLLSLGVKPREDYVKLIHDKKIRGLFIFGEDVPDVNLESLDFVAVKDSTLTATAQKAHAVFPGDRGIL